MTCARCTTPRKCDVWGCVPGTFPSEHNDPRPYKLRSIVPIEGLDQTLDPYQDWPQRPEQTFKINAMWGWLDEHGRWHASPNLPMTADEQRADNRARGWPCL